MPFAIPFVVVIAASVFTSASSAFASYGVKPMHNSPASQSTAAYRRLRILTGRNPKTDVDAGRDGIPPRAAHSISNAIRALLPYPMHEFPFPGAML